MGKSWYEEVLAADLKKAGISFVREHKFCPVRKFRFDFAILEQKIAIEVEGGTWSGGRHTRPQGFEDDCYKYNLACYYGWRVLRFTSAMVEANKVTPLVLVMTGEEPDASQASQEAAAQEEAPHASPKRGRPKGRRQTLRQRPSQTDRSREGLSEEGEGPAP